ncbi:zinc finger FYVE domain-containing protein 16-like isoform X2 [Limulus polyphemus]|uniref:Zinc finger FYVE domain-containing protein 16-like isoform X2 n=1 Tax=Limulus polyphemus TaxID=6850 RepID=A0ABM1B3T5_LIMPO|nr:zinc finger FYVE domain-containing protein 16-like isoform X2 [Limulus polyphemus]
MDKFTVDLDKVLDEFEENEDQQDKCSAGVWNSQQLYRSLRSSQHEKGLDNSCILDRKGVLSVPSRDLKPAHFQQPKNYWRAEYTDKIDLSEADFASNLKTSTLNPPPSIDDSKNQNNFMSSTDNDLLLQGPFISKGNSLANTVTIRNGSHIKSSSPISTTGQLINPSSLRNCSSSKPEHLSSVSTVLLKFNHSQYSRDIDNSEYQPHTSKTCESHNASLLPSHEASLTNRSTLSASDIKPQSKFEDHPFCNTDYISRFNVFNSKGNFINGYSGEEDQDVLCVSVPAETSSTSELTSQDQKYEIHLLSSNQMLHASSENEIKNVISSNSESIDCESFLPCMDTRNKDYDNEISELAYYHGVSKSLENDQSVTSEEIKKVEQNCNNSQPHKSTENEMFYFDQNTIQCGSYEMEYDSKESENHSTSQDSTLTAGIKQPLSQNSEEISSNDPTDTEQNEIDVPCHHIFIHEHHIKDIDVTPFQEKSSPMKVEDSSVIPDDEFSGVSKNHSTDDCKSHLNDKTSQNNYSSLSKNQEIRNDIHSQQAESEDLSCINSFPSEEKISEDLSDACHSLNPESHENGCKPKIKRFGSLSDEDVCEEEMEQYLSDVILQDSEETLDEKVEDDYEKKHLQELDELDNLYISDSNSMIKEENPNLLLLSDNMLQEELVDDFSNENLDISNCCIEKPDGNNCFPEELTMESYYTEEPLSSDWSNKKLMSEGSCVKESTSDNCFIEEELLINDSSVKEPVLSGSCVKESTGNKAEEIEILKSAGDNCENNSELKLCTESYDTDVSIRDEMKNKDNVCDVTPETEEACLFSLDSSCGAQLQSEITTSNETSDANTIVGDEDNFTEKGVENLLNTEEELVTSQQCVQFSETLDTDLIDTSTDLKSPSSVVTAECCTSVSEFKSSSQETTETAQPRVQRPTFLNLPSRAHAVSKPVLPPSSDSDETPSPEHQQETSGTDEIPAEVVDAAPPSDDSSNTVEFTNEEQSLQNLSAMLSEEEQMLGKVKPFWIPDTDAPSCMHCETRFTMIKRRHHCRACGKVLCAHCCNQKARLVCLVNKEARVCHNCLAVLNKVQAVERLTGSSVPASPNPGTGSIAVSPLYSGSNSAPTSPGFLPCESTVQDEERWQPDPNNPQEYCSTVSPLQQDNGSENRPPLTVMVPIGVLKRGDKPRGEPKQVMFSDGIRPGGDLTDLDNPPDYRAIPFRRQGRVQKKVTVSDSSSEPSSGGSSVLSSGRRKKGSGQDLRRRRIVISDSDGPLPPIFLPADVTSDDKPDINHLLKWMQDDSIRPIVFGLTKNLHILGKLVTLGCCYGKECWCFTSRGMCSVGQDEIVVVLEKQTNEDTVPRDIFRLFTTVYDNASSGTTVSDLGHMLFPEGMLGSRDHSGFLFVRPTFQCLGKLVLPTPPFLVAVLIQKWEVPWAKVFPLRLVLRLGYEYRYYPCPLVSVRFRKSVYGEIGSTIMNVLADFQNYQYMLSTVPGMFAQVKDKKSCIYIPRNRYDQMIKLLNSNNENVLAMATNFSKEADSHLVCVQNSEGVYQTQAINIQNVSHTRTGVSFVVFTGALKASSRLTGKSTIVEDGLLIQIPSETLLALRTALREMRDFTITCGPIAASEPDEVVTLEWTKDDKDCNIGVKSPIDGKDLDGVQSLRIQSGTDYAGERYLIRWTDVFLIKIDDDGSGRRSDPVDHIRLAEVISQAFCLALTPHLELLAEKELTKIGLRVTMDSEQVGYEVGSQEYTLPNIYMNDLDSALIPVISSPSCQEGHVCLELIFHILLK